jgi:arylsulfatase A
MKLNKILIASLTLVAGIVSLHAATPPDKPNIIYILGDDVGIGDMPSYGSDKFKTPTIDKLAHEGTLFTHAYAEPLCGPSRATILTGRYVFRTGATNQDATGLFTPKDETMTPLVLKQRGYVSAMIGKWGQLPLGPTDFGFDDYLQFQGSGIYWNTQAKGKTYELNGQTIDLKDNEYMPDVMHTHLVEFLEKHQKDPFYIYYSMSHIHAEILPTPDSQPESKNLYADNIAYMDKLIGKLLVELDRLHLREKTLIVYFGDNGTASGFAPHNTIHGRHLLGSKGSVLEGGSRVPFIVNWPGYTPAGKVSDDLIDSSDFFPTFAELTHSVIPSNRIIDGHSFLPQVLGQPTHPREWIFVELARKWYVADTHYKLTQAGKLYDLSDAPFNEKFIDPNTTDSNAIAARAKLSAVLAQLNPAGGHLDQGDGTGRHANKKPKYRENKAIKQAEAMDKNPGPAEPVNP